MSQKSCLFFLVIPETGMQLPCISPSRPLTSTIHLHAATGCGKQSHHLRDESSPMATWKGPFWG